jgi:type VI secretion system secreted protein Hcp
MRTVTQSLAVLLVAVLSSSLSAQQSIYMMVDPIKGDQAAPHAGEFKLNSFSAASANSVALGSATTGLAAGKASFSPVKVSLPFTATSSPLFSKSLASGAVLPSIEIRFYNSTRMFYKTVYENVYLTNVATEGSDVGTQEIDFIFSRVRWFAPSDPAGLTAPVQVGCWDVTLSKGC